MSLLTQAYLLEKYGVLLTVDDLAEETGNAVSTIYNKIAAKTFPIPTRLEEGKRVAHYQDAAAYFDSLRATTPA